MKFSKLLFYFYLLSIGAYSSSADTVTIVMQQGLNGYTGCEDATGQIIMDASVTPAVMDSALTDSNYAEVPFLYVESAS